jgi:hypothetical protein
MRVLLLVIMCESETVKLGNIFIPKKKLGNICFLEV